jgi:xylulose-5-phosphate/fructose-6-phosphate phosphoketolase
MTVLSSDELCHLDEYWRAANYLSVGQIYLLNNPLLREPLQAEHVKPRLLGHWGTTPGLNLIYAHLNRIIRNRNADVIYITGPGHGGPGLVANAYLEGTYSEVYTGIGQDAEGMRKLFRQFSFPGGIPSHVAPETPGSIHEGGELGYALIHAYGAAFDNPDLVVACVIGDGEAETGPLATSWHSNKFLNPITDGAVLPILHLNGYKIANPTVLARIPAAELDSLLHGYGYQPITVEGDDPKVVHQRMAAVLDQAFDQIAAIQNAARNDGVTDRPRWPMIVLPHSQGMDRAGDRGRDEYGALRADLRALAPTGTCRMSANPHANGGLLLRDLDMPDFSDYAVAVTKPATENAEATKVLGVFLRDVIADNRDRFRLMGPDETASNRLSPVFETTDRTWIADTIVGDDHLAADGRVMEVLSEHLCQGAAVLSREQQT